MFFTIRNRIGYNIDEKTLMTNNNKDVIFFIIQRIYTQELTS